MDFIWWWFILILSLGSSTTKGSLVTLEAIEWKFHRRLPDYKNYASISLERVDLPRHTLTVNLAINAFANEHSCSTRKVNIYCNQFGIPVVSRDGEVFPKNAHTPKMVPNITMATTNQTVEWVLSDLQEGSLFVMAILPHDDSRIRQKGLFTECKYYMSMRAVISYYEEGLMPLLTNKGTKSISVAGHSQKLIGFKVPPGTTSYEVLLSDCQNKSCNIKVSLWEALTPGMWNDSTQTVCTLMDASCTIPKLFPRTESYAYIGLNVLSEQNTSLSATLKLNTCTQNVVEKTAYGVKKACVIRLYRETPSSAGLGSGYTDRFVLWDRNTARPSKVVSIKVPDKEDNMPVLSYNLRGSDTGATLDLQLYKPDETKSTQKVEVTLCASLYTIVPASNCSSGATLKLDSQSKKKVVKVIIPYPRTGTWYISLHSSCFNGSANTSVKCADTPVANFTVSMSQCVDGGCSDYGQCKLYSSADMIYTACDCFSGWRGYGCNDGSKSDSLSSQKIAVYLLTFSNLAFIPGICLALYRRFFIEAFVYAFNMFFSTFYHACDSSNIYKLCIMQYNTLSFADFFSSLMSFSVTLLAMARIPFGLRSFLHMVAAMFVAVGEVHDRHGLLEQLMPIVTGLAIVALSWGYEMYRKKSLFPSKRRYLKFVIPGIALAVLGLSLNLALETDSNYKYVHSAWHILVASAILFLLPPRRNQKMEGPLSIQSGDVMSSQRALFTNDGHLPSFQNANEPDPVSTTESSPLPLNNGFMLANRTSRGSYEL